MNKNRKKYGKMWERLGACRGVQCIHQRPNWTTSHTVTRHSLHPCALHRIFSKTSLTHISRGGISGPLLVDGGKSTENQKNVKKCAFASAHRDGPGGVEFQFWVTSSISTATGTD